MNKIFLRNVTTFLFLISSLNAASDNDLVKNDKLLAEKKLNRIEGKVTPLKAVKKDFININFDTEDKSEENSQESVETSYDAYAKVKLIDVVLETLANSDLLKSSREKVIQFELRVKNSLANNYPTLDFEYNQGQSETYPDSDTNKYKFYEDKNLRFILRQNLYSGGAHSYEIKSVAKKFEVSKNQYRIVLEEEIKKSIKAYFQVVFANRSVMVNKRNMKKLNKILEIVTIKYENGAASIGDLTSIKASVANAKTKLVKEKSNFIESLKFYEYVVGEDFSETMPYEKNFDVDVGELAELYERSLEQNRSLQNFYRSIEAEKYKSRMSESTFKPKVDFELSFKRTFEEEDLEEEENLVNGRVKLTYNLFNGGRDKNKILEVNSGIRDLNYRLSEEKKKLKWNLSKIHTSITSVSEALSSTITEIKASRRMVTAYWDEFKLGESDLPTLLQGQRQLNSAETELIKFEKTHISDFFNILQLTGDLSSFFDVDPENPKFIDFSKSDYKKTVIADKVKELSLDGKEKKKEEKKKEDVLDEAIKEETKELVIPLPQISLEEKINNYLSEFLTFDEESFMIEIQKFDNIYDSFNFIKENDLDSNSFTYNVINNYTLETRIAHNNFKTKEEAESYLKVFEEKKLEKTYEIKKVKDIKKSYDSYISGLKIEPKKAKTKIKFVEKIRQEVKKIEYKTNEAFKNKFLSASNNMFTINIATFTKLDLVEKLIIENNLYENAFFFKYGDNGELIKLVEGLYSNYTEAENRVAFIKTLDSTLLPVVERVIQVKDLYEENFDINNVVEEEKEYEYVNLSKIQKQKTKKQKEINLNAIAKKEAEAKLEAQRIADEKAKTEAIKLAEEKKQKELEAQRIAQEIKAKKEAEAKLEAQRIADEKAKAEALKLAEEKKQKELEAQRIAQEIKAKKEAEAKLEAQRIADEKAKEEALKLAEEKKQKELEAQRIAQEIKAKKEAEAKLEAKRIADEKARLAKEKELAQKLEAQRIADEKAKEEALKLAEEKKQKELEAQRIAQEIKAKKEAEAKLEAQRIADEKAKTEAIKLAEEKKQKELEAQRIAQEIKAKKEAEAKLEAQRIADEKAKAEALKLAEEKKQKELEAQRIAQEIKAKKEAEAKLEAQRIADEKAKEEALKLAEEKKQKELEAQRIAQEIKAKKEAEAKLEAKRIADEKARLAKEKELAQKLEAQRIADEKAKEEALKLAEEKKQKELEAQRIAQEIKAKKEAEAKLEAKRIADEKARLAKEKELAQKLEAQRIADEKAKTEALKLAEEKKQKELEAQRIAQEIKAKKEAEAKLEAQRIADEKAKTEAIKLAEEKKQKELEAQRIAEEIKAKKEAEAKLEAQRIADEKAKAEALKLAEEKKQKELEAQRIAQEIKAKKEAEAKLEAQRIADEKAKTEAIKLAEEKKQKELEAQRIAEEIKAKKEAKAKLEAQKVSLPIEKKTTNLQLNDTPIKEIDFALGLKEQAVEKVIPYSQRVKNFKKEFYKTSKENFTLKLTTIDSTKVKWYLHRFGVEPDHVVIKKANSKKSTIYFGIFDSLANAKTKLESLHPIISSSNPPIQSIGEIR